MPLRKQGSVQRLIVAALLDSQLSQSDIRQVAKAFLTDHAFVSSIGHLLELLADGIQEDHPPTRHTTAAGWRRRVISAIKRQRLSKSQFLDTIHSLLPALPTSVAASTYTLDELLKSIEQGATPDEKQRIIRWLEESRGDDEYLKGIMKDR